MTFINKLNSDKNPQNGINVIVEIPKGSNIKYEIDVENGALFVDRKLSTTMFYPFNYGFIPNTKEDDDDPVDVFVLGDYPLVPMSVIRANPVGVLLTEDQDGRDSKIIAVPIEKVDPNFSNVTDINSIAEHIRNQIKHFIEHHKELEKGKYVRVVGWEDKEVAKKNISKAIERYNRQR
ncbi:MAG TPA: inorganic diphosphatase [Nitrososphaeraceae archaeon]|nr:inorganic diphosphatase [Nitrososphaeraceae archaeon]